MSTEERLIELKRVASLVSDPVLSLLIESAIRCESNRLKDEIEAADLLLGIG